MDPAGFLFQAWKRALPVPRLGPDPGLYRQGPKGLNWQKPKTVGLRQDKSQDLLRFSLF
jgi:hypothetical protein